MYRITDDVQRLIAFSVVETAASASYHLEPLAWVSQLTNLQAISSWVLKRWRRSLWESPAMVMVQMWSAQARKSALLVFCSAAVQGMTVWAAAANASRASRHLMPID